MEDRGQSQSCLPEWCTFLCTCADSTLIDVCDRLQNGAITFKELQKITEKRDQMEKLCSAHVPQDDPRNTEQIVGLKKILQLRITEQKHFTRTCDLLGFLCRRVTVKVIGKLLIEAH